MVDGLRRRGAVNLRTFKEYDMPEQQSTQNESSNDGKGTGATSTGGDSFKPITSQDDLNAVVAERIARERAKFADYADLKAKATRLDQIEEANKSEIQKAQDALAAAQSERDKALSEALRFKVASKHGISDEDAALFLTGTDEATLTKQAERLAGRTAARRTSGNVISREGGNQSPSGDGDGLREFTRNLFRATT